MSVCESVCECVFLEIALPHLTVQLNQINMKRSQRGGVSLGRAS